MGALSLRRRGRRTDLAVQSEPPPLVVPEDAEPLPDTPLTQALEALVAVVQSEGVHVAAERLERDPNALPGLARCVLEAQGATMVRTWEHAQAIAGDQRFEKLMGNLGLNWCATRPPATPWNNPHRERYDRFKFLHNHPHPSGAECPAILNPILDANEALVGLAVWFVKPDWSGLADLKPQMTVMGEMLGHSVRLRPATATRLVIAIDLAGAAVAFDRLGLPVWLALSAENLAEHFLPPEGPACRRDMIIWHDNANRPAALKAARRISEACPHANVELLSEKALRAIERDAAIAGSAA